MLIHNLLHGSPFDQPANAPGAQVRGISVVVTGNVCLESEMAGDLRTQRVKLTAPWPSSSCRTIALDNVVGKYMTVDGMVQAPRVATNDNVVLKGVDIMGPDWHRARHSKDVDQGIDLIMNAHHIQRIGCAVALLGVSCTIIFTLMYTHFSEYSMGDELVWVAIAFFIACCGCSYMALRRMVGGWIDIWSRALLLIGAGVLNIAMVVLGKDVLAITIQ